ncbi:MAG TPA: hypothetical protein VFL57_06995 [Bryobacteraceae bacterium]|nr:hypothetical protein [Bryobacteraceae bacterium]
MVRERFAPAMEGALLAAAFVMLAGHASAQSTTTFSLCTESGTLSSRVQFADLQRAKQILARRDKWAKQLSEFDLALRQKTAEPTSLQQFLAFASDAALDWTPEEQTAWRPLLEKLSAVLSGLNLRVPGIELVKTSGREEFGFAYTRARSIMFPQSMASIPITNPRAAFFLLAHELFHVLSRADSRLRDNLYALLGFEFVFGFEYPAEMESGRGSNPDAFEYEHAVTLQAGSERVQVIPLLHSRLPPAEVLRLPNIMESLDMALVSVDTATGEVRRDGNGRPITYNLANTNWVPFMSRNTSYILHPEEVLADNFAILIEWRADGAVPSANPSGFRLNDMDLLNAIRDVLEAGCNR